MKKYKLLSWIFLPFIMSACNGWLDVKPEDEIDENDLFETGIGYRHALNGVYFALGDINLYGKHLFPFWGKLLMRWDNVILTQMRGMVLRKCNSGPRVMIGIINT